MISQLKPMNMPTSYKKKQKRILYRTTFSLSNTLKWNSSKMNVYLLNSKTVIIGIMYEKFDPFCKCLLSAPHVDGGKTQGCCGQNRLMKTSFLPQELRTLEKKNTTSF